MTPGLIKSSKTKDKLYFNALGKAKDSIEYVKFTKYRNRYLSLKTIIKQTYYKNLLNDYKHDSRKTWSVLNALIKWTNNKTSITDRFTIDNKSINNPRTISNEFCSYFSEIGNKFASEIPKPSKPFTHHLRSRSVKSLFFHPTDQGEILKIVKSLKPKNSSGHDKVSSKLLKQLIEPLAEPISILINKSLQLAVFHKLSR